MTAATDDVSEPARALRCRNCGAGLPAQGIDRRLGTVTCEHCGGVHEIARGPAVGSGASAASSPVQRAPIAQPERFSIDRAAGGVTIRWRRGRRRSAFVLAAFAVAWLVLTSTTGLLPLMAIAPLLGYFALVRGINRVVLRADSRELVVRQGPLPWPGARQIDRADIVRLVSVEKLSTLRTGEDGREQVQTHRHYRVRALRRSANSVDVVTGLSSVDEALWLEREVEAALGIDDADHAFEVVG